MTFYCKKLTATTVLVNVRQLGDGFENRRTNFSGRAWATRGVANLAGSGHNRGSTKFSTPRPSLARRRPHHGFLMGTLGSSQAKKCHTYSAPHSSRADILKDGDVESNPGPPPRYPCGGCGKNVGYSRTNYSIRCHLCALWWHESCTTLTRKDFKQAEGRTWKCDKCSRPKVDNA